MAEIVVVSAAISAAIKLFEVGEKLGKFLKDNKAADRDQTKKKDVKKLHDELTWMHAFLLDAEKNKPGFRDSNLFQAWVSDVSHLANKCDHVADEIYLETLVQPKTGWRRLSNLVSYFGSDKFSSQIKELLENCKEISDRKIRYDPNGDAGNTIGNNYDFKKKLEQKRRKQSYASVENVVELTDTLDDLNQKLTNGSSGKFLISIVGMAGLGKTTLARKLYDKSEDYFECRAWIYVSSDYEIGDLLKELIKFMIPANEQNPNELTSIHLMESCLTNYLRSRRYLVVVDDLREAEDWESLENVFPYNNNGSRVIITTTNEQVVASNNVYVHRLRYLDENESWELFCSKALLHDTRYHSDLEEIGKQKVAQCRGLPLTIIDLGKKLSKTQVVSQWRNARSGALDEIEKRANAFLTLGFQDMPSHLKQCFLYIAMFPVDREIEKSRLMLLWEAEGFIRYGEGYAGDATKTYLKELVDRSFFPNTGPYWNDSTFRVHDFFQDLAIQMAHELGLHVYYSKETQDIKNAPYHTRLAVFHPQNKILGEYNNPGLNTLRGGELTGNARRPNASSQPPSRKLFRTLHEKFQWLRVLDIQISTASKSIPKAIGKLRHLRFLSFHFKHSPDVFKIPGAIENLVALQTLSISSGTVRLSKKVLNLKQLKHLFGDFKFLSDEIGSLESLETLAGIRCVQWCHLDTTKLENLRHLKLRSIEETGDIFYDNFKNLEKLQKLTLECVGGGDNLDIDLERIFELCPSISHLETRNISFRNSPSLNTVAKNLEVLEFHGTNIIDSISSIRRIPHLEALHVSVECEVGMIQSLFEEGFVELRSLRIKSSDSLDDTLKGYKPLLEHLDVYKPEALVQSNNV